VSEGEGTNHQEQQPSSNNMSAFLSVKTTNKNGHGRIQSKHTKKQQLNQWLVAFHLIFTHQLALGS